MPPKYNELDKLQSILSQSKTQRDNPALYQTVLGLIRNAQRQINILDTQIKAKPPSTGGGSDDVTGPSSSVDTDVVIFDGTSGKIIKDSGALFNDIARRDRGNVFTTGDNVFAGSSVEFRMANALTTYIDTVQPVGVRAFGIQSQGREFLIFPSDDTGGITGRIAFRYHHTTELLKLNERVLIYPESAWGITEVAFSTLPASPLIGTLANVSDSNTSTLGAIVAGSGSNHVLARFDGTNWRVAVPLSPISSGSGDVVGPSSATDNAIARYDTTTGKLIQNSLVTIDDSGNFFLPANVSILTASGALALGANSASSQVAINSTGFAPIVDNVLNLGGGSNRWKDAFIAGTVNAGSLGSTPLNGSNITSGTVVDARIDSTIARLASPTFTGVPAGPTAAFGTNTTQLATTAFVQGMIQTGVWAPIITSDGGASGQTYSVQMGNYIKFGKLVVAQFQVTFSNKGTLNGFIQIGGIPLFSSTISGSWMCDIMWYGLVTAFVKIALQVGSTPGGLAYIRPITGAATDIVNGVMSTSALGNGSAFLGTLIYGLT